MYPPFLISVVLLDYFIVFGGFWGFCCSLHKTKSRLDRAISNKPCREAVFSPKKFETAAWFSFRRKEGKFIFSSSGQLGKNFILSAPIRTIYASLLELSAFLSTLFPSFRLQHSWKSNFATAPAWQLRLTGRVHSQNFPLKILLFPDDPTGAFWGPFVM